MRLVLFPISAHVRLAVLSVICHLILLAIWISTFMSLPSLSPFTCPLWNKMIVPLSLICSRIPTKSLMRRILSVIGCFLLTPPAQLIVLVRQVPAVLISNGYSDIEWVYARVEIIKWNVQLLDEAYHVTSIYPFSKPRWIKAMGEGCNTFLHARLPGQRHVRFEPSQH